jgi:hypothetical protein
MPDAPSNPAEPPFTAPTSVLGVPLDQDSMSSEPESSNILEIPKEQTRMLDVHPPHHAVSSWGDFFIHLATITIGLLIAIGLEQTVEAIHHRHERAALIAVRIRT